MRLSEYAIDDLHQMATAELEHDPDAVAALHRLYAQLREQYISAFTAYRERAS